MSSHETIVIMNRCPRCREREQQITGEMKLLCLQCGLVRDIPEDLLMRLRQAPQLPGMENAK